MKHLVEHLWRSNREEILGKSLLDCHAKGLHSIMLSDTPRNRIRLYVSMPDSEIATIKPMEDFMNPPLSYHPHHCDLTLYCVHGVLMNNVITGVMGSKDTGNSLPLIRWEYKSKINTGAIEFKCDAPYLMFHDGLEFITTGKSLFLTSDSMHSVLTYYGQLTAWFVFEGKEDENYQPFAYSNRDLANQDFSGLYNKPSSGDVYELLKSVNLLD